MQYAVVDRSSHSWLRPAWTDQPEWMDDARADPAALAGNLRDLVRVNRWLGGVQLTVRGLGALTTDLCPGAPLQVLDVATGAADIPRAVHTWAERRGLSAQVVATDLSERILGLAVEACERGPVGVAEPSIAYAVADGRCLPFADRSFDVALCSLSLHHLAPPEARLMLQEMGRVARRGVVVNDLVRSWSGLVGAALYGWLCTRNRFTRHDGPLSVRRAYTVAELKSLLRDAGLAPIALDRFLGYRVALTAVTQPAPGREA